MSKKILIVSLSDEERQQLASYINTGIHAARSIKRARILLLADTRLSDPQIAKQVGVCTTTVFHTRRRYCREGVHAALTERPRPGAPRQFTGRDEANVTLLACTNPPTGRQRWTHRLLADKLVELEAVPTISYKTVERMLKKTTLSPGKSANGAFARSPADS
jgi:transposase